MRERDAQRKRNIFKKVTRILAKIPLYENGMVMPFKEEQKEIYMDS